ncbi:nitronate monooxygenase family protein [Lachnospiraceae bacterium 46-15]
MESLKIGNLILKKPIFQGGMGIGVSLSGLAGAVAKEGGAGTISAAQIGFMEEDFDENPLQANLRAMGKELKSARAAAPGGVLGFNIMTAMRHYKEYVMQAVKLGADFIVSGAGLPVELPALTGRHPTKLAPIVSTEKSARVILQYWAKKYNRIPDFVVIEGPKAGGHLGFTEEQLEGFSGDSYKAEIRRIIERIRQYEEQFRQKIPVVLGGGISSRELSSQAFVLGADAIQAASKFVTTRECDAAEAYKKAYIDAKKEDIILIKSPVGMPGRAVRNRFAEYVMHGGNISPKKCRRCLKKCNPAEIPYCITEALIRAVKGDTENGLIFCGADAYKSDRIETVAEVINELLP